MNIELFSQGNTLVHRLDPRVKLMVFIPAAFLCAASNEPHRLIAFSLAGVLLITLGRLWSPLLWQRMLTVNMFVFLLWLTLPFSVQGTPLITAGPFQVSQEGIRLSSLITLKTNTIAFMTIALAGTTPVISLAHALHHLRLPSKLVTVFYLFCRYTGVVTKEFETMRQTLKARGFTPSTSMHTIRTWAYVAGMLFIRSFERAERVYNNLLLRGFHGDFRLMDHFSTTSRDDILFLALSLCSLSLIMLL
ncbi:MAG TPA: cobalt ECF transporter T component CbiQ [Prosthecochloris aestuarii]|uniref:Cobalt ECF transporter T component CbiQ n=1 Tax=Prosthecochloris aestuarii TaxID=1102 RepID=A0A831SR81_PROAE|nr:cobalt ECF transporter T component CbiQ [Prosthecochloris aestuarii]